LLINKGNILVEFKINEKIIPLFYGIKDEKFVCELRNKICEEMMSIDYPDLGQHHLTMKYGGTEQPVDAKLSNAEWECIHVSSMP
jgi:hypothetical protein